MELPILANRRPLVSQLIGVRCFVGARQGIRGRRRRTTAAAIATAQTGIIVMRKGRIVSLAECESRSNAMKTRTVPIISKTKPAVNAGHLSDLTRADHNPWTIASPGVERRA